MGSTGDPAIDRLANKDALNTHATL